MINHNSAYFDGAQHNLVSYRKINGETSKDILFFTNTYEI